MQPLTSMLDLKCTKTAEKSWSCLLVTLCPWRWCYLMVHMTLSTDTRVCLYQWWYVLSKCTPVVICHISYIIQAVHIFSADILIYFILWFLWGYFILVWFLCQMVIWYRSCNLFRIIYIDNLNTGQSFERFLQNSCWKSLYMKISIFPKGSFSYCFRNGAYICYNLHKIIYSWHSWVCDVILTGLYWQV